jgi:ABC-2 type transport system permease protein
VRDAQRAPVVATSVGMPLIMVGLLPPVLLGSAASVLAVLPISLVTHGIRVLVEGGGVGAVRLDLLALAAWAVVMLAAAGRSFRWDA